MGERRELGAAYSPLDLFPLVVAADEMQRLHPSLFDENGVGEFEAEIAVNDYLADAPGDTGVEPEFVWVSTVSAYRNGVEEVVPGSMKKYAICK